MTKITIWYKLDKNNKKVFNHIERDWKENNKPIPNFKNQNSWLKYNWIKNFGYFNENNKVIEWNNI